MMRSPTNEEKSLFERICEEDRTSGGEGEFCMYNEKRLHRAVKRFIFESEGLNQSFEEELGGYETRVGRHVADILIRDVIYEIQTGSVRPLAKKLGYYIENTDYRVVIVIPLKKDTDILRVDRDSGELIRKKRSPKHESVKDRLCDLVYISGEIASRRIKVSFFEIGGEEQRYSERVRGRKSGAFEAEYFPLKLENITEYSSPEDFLEFLPSELLREEGFFAAEYGRAMKLSGRKLYNALNFFCGMGVILREKRDGKYVYFRK